MKWLNSFGDLLYEVMGWLVFYPITLWRAMVSPLQIMEYADTELRDAEDEQFTDTVNPPLFLLLSLLLTQAIDQAIDGTNPLIKDQHGLAVFITDDTSLLALRIVFFSMFPLVMAARLLRAKRIKLTRSRLKSPFYAQCYAAGPFALLLGLGLTVAQSSFITAMPLGLALAAMAVLMYLATQARWFSHHLSQQHLAGLLNAIRAFLQAAVAAAILAVVFA